MFVFGFFSNSFVTCHKEIDFFSSILFVALSRCDKDFFCLSHWVTATNGFFVCRTESLQQMDFLFVALSHCDKQNWSMLQKKCQNLLKRKKKIHKYIKRAKKAQQVPKRGKKYLKKIKHHWPFLAFLWEHLQILFVTVTKWNKQKIRLSQWLSATNKTNLCLSD